MAGSGGTSRPGFRFQVRTQALKDACAGSPEEAPMSPTAIATPLSQSEHDAQLRRAVVASTIGTAIEWYDFFLYGTAAGLIFGKLFFPHEDALTATLAAFGTYFIGFI